MTCLVAWKIKKEINLASSQGDVEESEGSSELEVGYFAYSFLVDLKEDLLEGAGRGGKEVS